MSKIIFFIIYFTFILINIQPAVSAQTTETDSFEGLDLPKELLLELGDSSSENLESDIPELSEIENLLSSEDSESSSFLDRFQIGLDIDGSYNSIRKNSPINPENKLITYNEKSVVTKLDFIWTPKLTDSLTFRTRSILKYEYEWLESGSNDEFSRYFMEGYFQWVNAKRTVTLDLGKEKIDWGVSTGWTPINVLIPLPQTDDQYNEDIDNEGLGLINIEYANFNITANLVIAQLKKDRDDRDDKKQSAFKLSTNVEPWELGLVNHQANDTAPSNGVYFNGLITNTLELHGEWIRTSERNRQVLNKVHDGYYVDTLYTPAYYSLVDDTQVKNFDKILIGTKYTFSNDSNLNLEYYHTDHGYNKKEWNKFKDGIKESNRDDAWKNDSFNSSAGNKYSGYLYSVTGLLSDARNKKNFDLRQSYLFLSFFSGESDSLWEWSHFFRLNLDDNSQTHTSVLNKSWNDFFKTEFSAVIYRGDKYSEYGLSPFKEIYSVTAKLLF